MLRVHFSLDGKRPPLQRELDALFAAADRFELRPRDGTGHDGAVLIHGEAGALSELSSALRIREDSTSGFHCMCRGDLGLVLKRGKKTTVVLGLHHGAGIRHEAWDSDADLLEPRRFAEFLDAHGMHGQLAAFDSAEASQRQNLAGRNAWADCAPPCLHGFARSLSPSAPSPMQTALDGPIAILLQNCHGDAHAAREALLRWSGAHMSKWDIYPAYETVPTYMLARMALDRAIDAHLQSPAADDPKLLLGLSRYIATHGLSTFGIDSLKRGLGDAARQKMLQLAAPYDVYGKLAASLEPQALELQVPHGATLEHVFEEAHCYGLCSDGERFYGVDGTRIVRFDPGERRPQPICEVGRDVRIQLSAHRPGIVVAEGPRLFRLSPEGERRELLQLPQPPDSLHAFSDHILWVTNSDPGNPIGRTYSLQGCTWEAGPVRTLLAPDENPPYGIREDEGRWVALRRRTKRGLLGRKTQSIALFEIDKEAFHSDSEVSASERYDFRSNEMLDVMSATPGIPAETQGSEQPGIFIAAKKNLFRIPKTGRIERIELDVMPRRLAQTAHGPVFMVDCEDHLRIEQRTVLRAPRYVLDLPRLPWPSILIARGDYLWIAVGSAVIKTRI